MLMHYFILGVSQDASDEEIRNSYLRLVKKYTPEKKPIEFGRVTEAYEALKDRRSRVEMKMFGALNTHNSEAILYSLLNSKEIKPKRVHLDELLKAEEKAKKRIKK